MQVEYLATISLPDEGWDVNALEQACFRAAEMPPSSFSSEH
jgi:hypothetical protein